MAGAPPPPPPPPFIQGATAVAAAASVSGGGFPPPFPHLTPPVHHIPRPLPFPGLPSAESLLHYSFPSQADTLAYVDALKHSDLSDWRSLQEVAARAGGGSCSGAVTTSVLTALYLLGLFNLCSASPVSCCVLPASGRRRRRRTVDATLPPLLNNLQHNLSSLSLEQFRDLPHVATPDGGRIPLHISVVDQVRKLWDSNPHLLSSVPCSSPTESVRSSFITLSGVASGLILEYSVAQLTQCYPDDTPDPHIPPKIWFFPIPNTTPPPKYPVITLPSEIPVKGDDEEDDGCERNEVPLGYDKCAALLSADNCPYKHWVLLNKETGMGECVPRLCSENFVYVEADEMCHDINEPGICPGNRRLYLTASGNAVCDCPEGMFPGPQDTCYFLHEPAYCLKGSVLQFDKPTKSLVCRPDPCGHINNNLWPDDLPYAPHKDGFCYQFNEQGPCKKGQRFGFDSDKLEASCVSMLEAGLLRPRRSYMYQQMSYPATQDHQYPHYQVSYIIMNGSTWALEVKGIGRKRRDAHPSLTSPHYLQDGEMAVPFIDTRDIARDFHPFMKPRVPRWVINRRNRRGSNHSKGQKSESRSQSNRTSRAKGDKRTDKVTVAETPSSSGDETDSGPLLSSIFGTGRSATDGDKSVRSSSEQVSQKKKGAKNAKTPKVNRRGRKHDQKAESSSGGTEGSTLLEVIQSHLEEQITTSLGRGETSKGREVVKVEQPETSLPVVVQEVTQSPREERGRGKKKNRGSSKVRKKKKKKHRRNRGRNRGRGGRRGRNKPNKSKNGTKTDRDHKRKNPKLPHRVPTVQPPGDGNTTLVTASGTSSNITAVEETSGVTGVTMDSRKPVVKGSGDSSVGVRDRSTKSDSDGAVRTKPHRVSETDSDSGVYEDEEKENQTSSSETTLPKYLRHRGRRQLEGGGIIQAPLLSACKPGAKRDYNYKCRPKFIPQERDRHGGTNAGTLGNTAPRPPRISCPEGTRLDPRGKCQQVS
ncbi:uncharacterized protein [Macrobrachium rosenbergii]|uniref:uncharacterized protein n=1 Tax=Macrobrachium rosenbergii TaxID=79674 RepID=UPI0034D73A19